MTKRFNETRKWAIRENGPHGILTLQTPNDPYDGFVGATFFTREAAERARIDSNIDGEVVPVLLLVIEVSKAEADADWRYFKTLAERAAGIGQPRREFYAIIIDSLRKRIALLQEELEEALTRLAQTKEGE